jgi:hypothetical protein
MIRSERTAEIGETYCCPTCARRARRSTRKLLLKLLQSRESRRLHLPSQFRGENLRLCDLGGFGKQVLGLGNLMRDRRILHQPTWVC